MKNKKLTDAIGMISDEYIEDARKPVKKWNFNFNRQTIVKFATVAACFLLAITVLPKMFSSAKNASGGASPDYGDTSGGFNYYYEEANGMMPESDEAYYEANNAKTEDTASDSLRQNKKLIVNGNLSLETLELDELINKLTANVNNVGGYIQSSSISTYNNSRHYDATIRIPADKYEEFLNTIRESGNTISYSESTQDITDAYTDIEARLKSLRAQQEKVLEFYDQATTIEELMSIEQRLSEISYEIEYYEAQIKNYDLLVSYSTLNISIKETKTYTPENNSFIHRLRNAFVNGWYSFTNGIGDFIIDVIYNLWTIILLIVIGFIGYRLYRRFIKKRQA